MVLKVKNLNYDCDKILVSTAQPDYDVQAIWEIRFFTKAKAIMEEIRTESYEKGRRTSEYGKRENKSQNLMGEWGRLPMET